MTNSGKHDPEGADREAQQHPEGNATQRTEHPQLGVTLETGAASEMENDIPQDMSDPDVPGPRDIGPPGELRNDKMTVEDVLRAEDRQGRKNPNDQPGYDDGRLGGHDGEDRQGDPVQDDAQGKSEGGVGAARSSGFDGGPPRH